ncbi:mycothiol synthase [Kineosporia sp. R_H_3]|uniref:mycothiol synthase n=1 Tax=Kineosporia sp. R_H_3 TaxID=1961848 RepID=UPI001E46A0EB|nr:mycothiol synthase [Kineosporia sp. R_H_3]
MDPAVQPAPDRRDVPGARLVVTGTLAPADVARVFALVDAATVADGVRPLSEHVTLHVRYGGEGPDRNLLLVVPDDGAQPDDGTPAAGAGSPPPVVRPGERLVGYAHLDPTDVVAGAAVEIVVHPGSRGAGHGRRLVEAAAAATPDGRLRLWAHGDNSSARALAASLGFREVRRLEQMRRSLWSPLPEARIPDGVTVRAFRPGTDDAEWLALNAKAFAHHPEQGGWTAADLGARMREAWFDPGGFLVAFDDTTGAMVAFHWTKIHGGDGHDRGPAATGRAAADGADPQPHAHPHAHDPIGEVYVVGVDPAAQGRGLGRAMTLAGLQWLRARGLPQAMLYVEADNAPALAVYRSLGFTHWDTDVMFSRPTGAAPDR